MFKQLARLSCVIACVAMLGGCDMLGLGGATPVLPAVQMLPDLPGHKVVEGQTLTTYISTLSGGAVLLAGQPELTALIAAVDGVVSCYQEVGAMQARVYSNEANPLSSGTVAIADRNALLDPVNVFRCVVPKKGILGVETFQPCMSNYTLSKDGNEFYILYAGTTLEICQAFCAQLEGCTAHKP